MKHRLILAALATVLFTAQAEAQRQRSEALEIARATLIRGAVRDVPREDLEEALAGTPDMSLNYALDALGVATGVFDQATSLSRLGEVGVFAALAFFAPSEGPESWPATFAWMPREDAPSPREANAIFQQVFLAAVRSTLPEHLVSVGDWADAHWNLSVTGPGCTPCGMYSRMWARGMPAKTKAPSVMGGYPAYRWGGKVADGGIGGYPLVEGLTLEERLVFYQTLSSHLPTWAYIYLPPHDMLLDFPLMFNEGEALYFIEPAAEDEDAG